MRFLLDTNVLSELRKPRPHGAVLAWSAAQPPFSYAIPSIALYELQAGVEIVRQHDLGKAAEIEQWMGKLSRVAIILPLDDAAAIETAKLMHGKSLDLLEDAMIAAIAKTRGLTIATRNSKHFASFPVDHFNPFDFRS